MFRHLVKRSYRLRNALKHVQMLLLAAMVHTPELGFRLTQRRQERPWLVPIRARVSGLLASLAQALVAGSTPIDRPLATVLAHTQFFAEQMHLRAICAFFVPAEAPQALRY